VLLLHRQTEYYPNLVSILVYPTTYLVPGVRYPDGLVAEGTQARLGESWARDVVVLAWEQVLSGAADIHDGHNVVLHELRINDQESGTGDARRFFPALDVRRVGAGARHDFDHWCATRPTTTTLIDRYARPIRQFLLLRRDLLESRAASVKHPELYLQLQQFYSQNRLH